MSITEVGPADGEPAGPADPTDDDLDDAAWLETLPARVALAALPRRRFDIDALAFRRAQPAVREFRLKLRPILARAKVNGDATSWASYTSHYLRSKHPRDWQACAECRGAARIPLIGQCPACRGEGYQR